jgi:hypothetical protein
MAKKCEHDRIQCAICSPEKVFRQYAYKAKKRNLSFSLTLEEFEKLTGAPCHYCNEYPSMGIDRVDNRIGYNSRNVVPCCMECNFMKRAMLPHRFIYRALKIAKHQESLKKKAA